MSCKSLFCLAIFIIINIILQVKTFTPDRNVRPYLRKRCLFPIKIDDAILEESRKRIESILEQGDQLPNNFDWVKEGAVTPVQNQGGCGSCWAFGCVAMLEGQYFKKYKTLIKFSESELVDCDKIDKGCDGGDLLTPYKYLESVGGLTTEDNYPYDDGNNISPTCKLNKTEIVLKLSAEKPLVANNTSANVLKKMLYQRGPLLVGIDATDVEDYSHGVLLNKDAKCSNTYDMLDHAVTIVGYGVDNGINYWKVKNSWGASWGEQGYFRIERGKNTCGIELVGIVYNVE